MGEWSSAASGVRRGSCADAIAGAVARTANERAPAERTAAGPDLPSLRILITGNLEVKHDTPTRGILRRAGATLHRVVTTIICSPAPVGPPSGPWKTQQVCKAAGETRASRHVFPAARRPIVSPWSTAQYARNNHDPGIGLDSLSLLISSDVQLCPFQPVRNHRDPADGHSRKRSCHFTNVARQQLSLRPLVTTSAGEREQ